MRTRFRAARQKSSRFRTWRMFPLRLRWTCGEIYTRGWAMRWFSCREFLGSIFIVHWCCPQAGWKLTTNCSTSFLCDRYGSCGFGWCFVLRYYSCGCESMSEVLLIGYNVYCVSSRFSNFWSWCTFELKKNNNIKLKSNRRRNKSTYSLFSQPS